MAASRSVRARLTSDLLLERLPAADDVQALRRDLASLEAVPRQGGTRRLRHDGRDLSFDLSYEIDELRKDLLYIEQGEQALLDELARRNPGFSADLEAARGFLEGAPARFRVWLSDRDGTVNNYCARYSSSVQSVYNAVFLARFIRRRCQRAVILSSAPLQGGGLVELSVLPPGLAVLAASKGREALDEQGLPHRLPIPETQQALLDRLNGELARLIRRPRFRVFGLVGSGLQYKYGQSTVAYQDVHGSIPTELSASFGAEVRALVGRLDPDWSTLRIEDTGRDLEILLTVGHEGGHGLRDFDKGDGVRYLDRELGLGLGQGASLVCGDTASDLPMAAAVVEAQTAARAGGEAWCLFVTGDSALRRAVREVCPRAGFVGAPDALVALLNEMAKEG